MLGRILGQVKFWIYSNIHQPTNVYASLSPLLRPCYYLGLAPYCLKKHTNKNHTIHYSKWANFFNLVIVLLNTFLILWNLHCYSSELFAEKHFKQKLMYYQEVTAGILALCGILCSFIFSKKLMTIFPSIEQVDESLKVLFVWIDHSAVHMRAVITLFLAGAYFVMGALWFALEYMNKVKRIFLQEHDAFVIIKLLIPYYITIILELQYCHYLSLVQTRYKLLNDYLRTFVCKENTRNNGWTNNTITTISKDEKDDTYLAKKILRASDPVFVVDHIAALHIKLTDIALLINRSFAIQQLLKVAVTFVSVVSALYFIAIHFSKAESESLDLLFVLWAFSNALEVCAIVHVTSETSEEANTCPRILHKIRNNSDNQELQETIEIYSLQMYHNRLAFSVLGLFPMDYTLLYSMVAGITTYLVILIQFNQQDFMPMVNETGIIRTNVTRNSSL